MARVTRAPMPVKPVPLKTIHTYPSKNGNASLSIFSYPQRVPTFMGGSYERGWGPLAGTVDIQVTEPSGDRVNAIKLTLTATQSITVPKAATTDAPSALDRMAIEPDENKTKEVTLLHLEHVLYKPLKADADANLLAQGKHTYPFSIELPLLGNKVKNSSQLLPPSCVIEPLLLGPNDAKLRQSSSTIFGRPKTNGKDVARPAWVTVKYQLKVTVQRPGLLKRNLRSYAPFVYLPPPPTSAATLLLQRRALGASMSAIVLQQQGDGCQPIETPGEWRQRSISFLTSPNGPQKLGPEKKAGFLSSIFSGPKKQHVMHWHEAWTFSMPMSGRSSFPLRSAIPFVVRCTTNKPINLSGSSPLAFRLYRRMRMLTGKKQKAIAMQQEPVAEAALRYTIESQGVHRINGVIALPPNCVPNFEIHNLALDYYVAVVRLADGAVLHKEAVNLACPPPVEPRTAYGPYSSGPAWRAAREAALSPQESPSSSEDYSPPLAPRMSEPSVPSPASRQRPSFSSVASSSSSSAHVSSRRTSMAPSLRSYRSGSTDSNMYGSAASTMSHPNLNPASTAGTAPMGLAGMSNPPPASSAGASGLGPTYLQYAGNLDPVREQSHAPSPRHIAASSSARLAAPLDATIAAADTSDTASVASSRRHGRYSSAGALPIVEAGSSRRSSVEPDARHAQVQASLDPAPRFNSPGGSTADAGHSRRGLFATNADELPSIPAKASSSAREQANALVGTASSSSRRGQKRADKDRRGSSSTASRRREVSARPKAASTSRPLPTPPTPPVAQPPSPTLTLSPPPAFAPTPNPAHETTLLDPATLLDNEDLLYGEDIELDLPPSYFEAVHDADDDG